MMKSIMISIKPKWCELIASGKKTIEIRKTRPKIDTPFKCYIYCTNSGRPIVWGSPVPYYTDEKLTQTYGYSREDADKIFGCWNGKVIGEFVCDEISKFTAEFTDCEAYEDIRYHYLDEFYEDQDMIVVSNEWNNPNDSWICTESCLSFDDFKKYIGINFHDIPFYSWRISELQIYDEPKKLTDFKVKDNYRIKRCAARERVYNNPDFTNESLLKGAYYCNKYNDFCDKCLTKELTNPPKSWCYVNELR